MPLKASPSLSGVVIDKKLFSRAIKTRSSKMADKAKLPKIDAEFEEKVSELKEILVNKLRTLTEKKTTQGVFDLLGAEVITKGQRFTKQILESLEYSSIQSDCWTTDERTNDLVSKLIVNYLHKYKEYDAENKRNKLTLTIGDELPSIIIRWQRFMWPKNAR